MNRFIKFNYYELMNGDKTFFLEEWLEINQEKISERLFIDFNIYDKVMISNYKEIGKHLVAFRIEALKDHGIPKKIKERVEPQDIDLDLDEYLGDDTTFVYNKQKRVLMIQVNRAGISASKFVKLINEDNLFNVSIIPIVDTQRKSKLDKNAKKIELSLKPTKDQIKNINTNELPFNTMVDSIVDASKESNINTVKITMSANGKNKWIEEIFKRDVIKSVGEMQDLITKAVMYVENEDETDSNIMAVNLFDNHLTDYIEFSFERSKGIGFEYLTDRMVSSFSQRF